MTLTGGNCLYCGLGGGHRPNCPEHPDLPEGWRVANLMAHELMRAFPMQQTYVDSVQAARVVADELLEARVERDRLAMQLEAAQAALRDAIASSTANGEERAAALAHLATARALLMDCWHQLDGDVYVLPGGEVHPGAVTTIHDLHAFLWPEGKTI